MSDYTSDFWGAFNDAGQQPEPVLPSPTIPQAPATPVEEQQLGMSRAEWMTANANTSLHPGADVLVVPNNRSWQYNSNRGQGVGIFGNAREQRAKQQEAMDDIRSGRYETRKGIQTSSRPSTGEGVLGALGLDANPRAAAATLAALNGRDEAGVPSGYWVTKSKTMDDLSR